MAKLGIFIILFALLSGFKCVNLRGETESISLNSYVILLNDIYCHSCVKKLVNSIKSNTKGKVIAICQWKKRAISRKQSSELLKNQYGIDSVYFENPNCQNSLFEVHNLQNTPALLYSTTHDQSTIIPDSVLLKFNYDIRKIDKYRLES